MQGQKEERVFKKDIQKNNIRGWYEDKAFGITVQRNVLFIICILLFVAVIISLTAIKSIVEKQSIEPYVIKVSDQDQIPISVNMNSVINYANINQGVVEYFLIQYINLREGYNFSTYKYDYNNVVKRMSSDQVYNEFWNNVNSQEGLINTIGRNGSVDVTIKQLIPDTKNNIVIMRIAKRLTVNGSVKSISNFQIKMHYIFNTTGLSYRDIVLNPLGIKVDFYETTEEVVREIN